MSNKTNALPILTHLEASKHFFALRANMRNPAEYYDIEMESFRDCWIEQCQNSTLTINTVIGTEVVQKRIHFTQIITEVTQDYWSQKSHNNQVMQELDACEADEFDLDSTTVELFLKLLRSKRMHNMLTNISTDAREGTVSVVEMHVLGQMFRCPKPLEAVNCRFEFVWEDSFDDTDDDDGDVLSNLFKRAGEES